MKALAIVALAVLLSGCGTTALNSLAENSACTVRVSGKVAFGSITPTGTLNYSAVCKPSEGAPPVAIVPVPPTPDEAAAAPR